MPTSEIERATERVSQLSKQIAPPKHRDHGKIFVLRPKEDVLHSFNPFYPDGITESSDKRRATPGRLAALAAACGSQISKEQWRTELHNAVQVRTLWDGDVLVGFGLMTRTQSIAIFDRALIRPYYRGKGLFRTMFGKALQSLKAEGLDELYICADPASATLYEKLGWRELTASR